MDQNKTAQESELDPNTGLDLDSTSFNKSKRMYSASASTSWNSDKFAHEIECIELAPEEVDKIRQYAQALKEKNINNESCPFRWINRQERKRLLPESVQKLSLSRAIQYKIAEIPTVEEIQDFTLALETSSKVVIVDETQKMIDFDDFLEILRKSPRRLHDIMEPGTLWGVSQESLDENGRMQTEIIIQYISLKCSLWRYRTMLARYDEDCTGSLSKQQLKDFMLDEVIPVTDHLRELKNEALDDYLLTVQSMFFFFMDQKNFGYCRIADILVSGFLENIFGMQCATDDPETYERVICENWFSYDKTAELRSLFKMLDDDEKGHLTKSDFAKVNDNAYTPACVDRFFEVHVANRGEKMSYEEFVIFMIAQNHLAHPASLAYFYKILDIHDKGYLTQFDLKYFYRSMKVAYEDYISIDSMPPFEDYCDELYDMTQSRNSKRIYLKDILNCKQGHDVVLCLLNCYEFYRYETREGQDNGDLDGADSVMPADEDGNEQDADEGGATSEENAEDESHSERESKIQNEVVCVLGSERKYGQTPSQGFPGAVANKCNVLISPSCLPQHSQPTIFPLQMQMRRPASVVIFLLFAVGTIRSVRISWLGQEKDENKRSTILHHTYRPESPAGFSFLINAQISGRIAPDINQTNESLWLKFDIEDVFNITTTILNMTVLNSSSTEQYLAWTTVGTNQSLNRSIIHIDSDSLLMRAQFKPANFGPENDEINTKGVMSTDQSQPWELMLLFHISGDCGSWLWGYWGGCSNHFFLDAYGMKANLVEERQNASTNGTEYVNQVFVWTSSYLGDKIWDNDRNKMKTGFQCSDTTLDFSHGHNNETLSIETPSGAELTFAELKIAAFLDMEKEPHSFSRLFSFNKCAQDEFHWPWWMEVLGDSIRRNLDKYIFGAILLIILFAMLKKYRRDRERKMLGTHFGYNNMTGPFSLEEFDEVDVITPLDIRKKRGSQRMIY